MENNQLAFSKILDNLSYRKPAVVARAISLVENEAEGYGTFMQMLPEGKAPVIGVTGPPGAGKSSLINSMVKHLTSEHKQVAIVAVDPTSPFTKGSLLGDRIRMSDHFLNEQVFIRSMATRGTLGGLSAKSIEITDILGAAGYDYIIIETVGVGQSEVEIAGLAGTVLLVLVPESGDEVQFIKSGIMEIADIFVVNKSDRPGAGVFSNTLQKLATSHPKDGWDIPVIKTIAINDTGTYELMEKVREHITHHLTHEKNIQLLSEKVWHLIANLRMKNLDFENVKAELSSEIRKKDFNLYRFIEKFRG